MTGMTPERLAEIRTRAEAATPGPWEAEDYSTDPGDEGSCITAGEPGTMRQRAVAYAIDYPWTTPESCAADATFIAAARTVVPELVTEVERLQARVGSCDGGCNYETGPEETCSLHGRPVAEVWQIVNDVAAERDARITTLAQQVKKVRALHREAYAIFSWQSGLRYEDPCPDCHGAAGVHPCGCWTDQQVEYVCAECHRTQGGGPSAAYPCKTILALDAPTTLLKTVV